MGILHKALLDLNKRPSTPVSPQALGAPLLILLPAAGHNFSVFTVCLESPREERAGVGERWNLLLHVSYSMAVRIVAGPSVVAALASVQWCPGLGIPNRKSASSATRS